MPSFVWFTCARIKHVFIQLRKWDLCSNCSRHWAGATTVGGAEGLLSVDGISPSTVVSLKLAWGRTPTLRWLISSFVFRISYAKNTKKIWKIKRTKKYLFAFLNQFAFICVVRMLSFLWLKWWIVALFIPLVCLSYSLVSYLSFEIVGFHDRALALNLWVAKSMIFV
jgi:hypothetical protein